MSKKSTQTTNQVTNQATHQDTAGTTAGVTHQVQTPDNPSWITDPVQNVAGQIGALSNLNPQSLIAGPDPLQTQAGAGAAGLTTPQTYQDAISALNGAGSAGASSAAPASLLENLGAYMSPYTKDVVDATSNDLDASDGRVRAQQALALGGSGAFGGSGAALTQSATEGELSRARASALGALRNQGFTQGAQLSEADAARRQQASMFNASERDADLARQAQAASSGANIATAADADTRANLGAQSSIGQILQALQQAKVGAPISLLGTQTSLLDSLPLSLFHGTTNDGTAVGSSTGTSDGTMNGTTNGTTTTQTSDPLGSLGSAALMAGALFGAPFTGGGSLGLLGSLAGGLNIGGAGALASGLGAFSSDRRLKRDILRLGRLENGLGVYLYRYLWSPVQFIGVMAQEVLKVKPQAVVTLPNGFLAVHYGML